MLYIVICHNGNNPLSTRSNWIIPYNEPYIIIIFNNSQLDNPFQLVLCVFYVFACLSDIWDTKNMFCRIKVCHKQRLVMVISLIPTKIE